ncbi:MAG TPA: GNAT family N-acetyltransferase [Usitatibacter sp.]|nr:GNAT family N-acetyltransferase [Usitatibacter sp.]
MKTNESRLVEPSEAYRRSFVEAIREFQADSYSLNAGGMGKYRGLNIEDLEADFGGYLRDLAEAAEESKLKPGLVPQTTYWLVEGPDFIGRVSLRHRLNDDLMRIGGQIGYEIRPSMRRRGYGTQALRLGLAKARDLGLERILVTCDSVNLPSRKIIERNGGVFEDELAYSDDKPPKHRFWIDVTAARGRDGRR